MLEMKWKMDECRWIYMDNRPEDSVAGEVQVLAKLEINILGLPEISRASHLSFSSGTVEACDHDWII